MTENFSENQTALTPGLTQLERVSNTFTAPSKTFNDIAAGNKSWWLPFLIMIVFGYLFFVRLNSLYLLSIGRSLASRVPAGSGAEAMVFRGETHSRF